MGSFGNALAWRVARDEDWVWQRSRCDHCGQPIQWFRNLPMISFLWQGGKAKCCGKKLAISHLGAEIGGAAVGLGWLIWTWSLTPLSTTQWIGQVVMLVALWLLWAVVLADFQYWLIPDVLVIGLIVLLVGWRIIEFFISPSLPPYTPLFGLALTVTITAIMFFIWYLTRGRGLGFGDVKLMIPLGLFLFDVRVLIGWLVAFVLGTVVGLGLILIGRGKFGQAIPFGPFLIAGFVIALLIGDQIWNWYSRLL